MKNNQLLNTQKKDGKLIQYFNVDGYVLKLTESLGEEEPKHTVNIISEEEYRKCEKEIYWERATNLLFSMLGVGESESDKRGEIDEKLYQGIKEIADLMNSKEGCEQLSGEKKEKEMIHPDDINAIPYKKEFFIMRLSPKIRMYTMATVYIDPTNYYDDCEARSYGTKFSLHTAREVEDSEDQDLLSYVKANSPGTHSISGDAEGVLEWAFRQIGDKKNDYLWPHSRFIKDEIKGDRVLKLPSHAEAAKVLSLYGNEDAQFIVYKIKQ